MSIENYKALREAAGNETTFETIWELANDIVREHADENGSPEKYIKPEDGSEEQEFLVALGDLAIEIGGLSLNPIDFESKLATLEAHNLSEKCEIVEILCHDPTTPPRDMSIAMAKLSAAICRFRVMMPRKIKTSDQTVM